MSDSSYWTYLVSSSFSGICVVSFFGMAASWLKSAQQLNVLIVLDDAVSLPLSQRATRALSHIFASFDRPADTVSVN
jgi:hypothetical protein